VSHEYRTPLNAIRYCAESVKRHLKSNPEQLRFVEIILVNVELLLSLIDDILDNSKIERNILNLSFHEFHLKSLFEEINNIFEI